MLLSNSITRSLSARSAPHASCAPPASPLRPSARHLSSRTTHTTLSSRSVLTRATTDDDFRPDGLEQQEHEPKQQQQQQQQQQAAQSASEQTSTSRCPFPHDVLETHTPAAPTVVPRQAAASTGSGHGSEGAEAAGTSSSTGFQVQGMKGPNWRVLPAGASQQVPEVPCRPVVVDESNPMGELVEFDALGAAAFLFQRYKEFGPVFSWQMGPIKLITMLDYEAVKSLLLADNKVIVGWNPESFYMMLGERVRQSMENPPVRVASRRMVQQGFTKDAMGGYIDKLVGICRNQLEEWSSGDGPVDLAARGKDLSFEFSTQLLVDFEVLPEQKPALRAKMDRLFMGLFSAPDPTPGSAFSEGIRARDELLQDMSELVRQREARMDAKRAGGTTHKSVMEYILEDMRTWNDGKVDCEIAAQSGMGILVAGNDTSGQGVSAILATLQYFPQVMDKIRQEQQQVMAQHGPGLTPSALDAMTYTDAVIKEVLRVTPPSASVFRKATVDLEVCGKFVPAGSPLLLSTFMPQIFTDPHLKLSGLSKEDFAALEHNWASVNAALLKHEFKPERWLEGSKSDKPSGLLTFSAGPHVCLGMGLFMAEAKVLLALLAREYDITPADDSSDVDFKVSFFTLLKKGMVKISKKQQQPVAAC